MTLGDVHVNRDGTIRYGGEAIGFVYKTEGPSLGKYRAEFGDPARPEEWPPYRACYRATRKAAVQDALADLEHPAS